MLTPEGATLVWSALTNVATLTVAILGPNGEEATADADAHVDGATLNVVATFDGLVANFEWAAREVRTSEGVVLDREDDDGGRKTPGTVWTVEIALDLAPQGT